MKWDQKSKQEVEQLRKLLTAEEYKMLIQQENRTVRSQLLTIMDAYISDVQKSYKVVGEIMLNHADTLPPTLRYKLSSTIRAVADLGEKSCVAQKFGLLQQILLTIYDRALALYAYQYQVITEEMQTEVQDKLVDFYMLHFFNEQQFKGKFNTQFLAVKVLQNQQLLKGVNHLGAFKSKVLSDYSIVQDCYSPIFKRQRLKALLDEQLAKSLAALMQNQHLWCQFSQIIKEQVESIQKCNKAEQSWRERSSLLLGELLTLAQEEKMQQMVQFIAILVKKHGFIYQKGRLPKHCDWQLAGLTAILLGYCNSNKQRPCFQKSFHQKVKALLSLPLGYIMADKLVEQVVSVAQNYILQKELDRGCFRFQELKGEQVLSQNSLNELCFASFKVNERVFFKMQKPPLLKVELLSKPGVTRGRVNVLVSGFTSEDCDKRLLWESLISQLEGEECYGVTFESSTVYKLGVDIITTGISTYFGGIVKRLITIADKQKSNQYVSAKQNAQKAGFMLGSVLHQLFPGVRVDIFAFSLGTQLVLEALKAVLVSEHSEQVHRVVLMGGVASAKQLKKVAARYDVVNCWTNSDYVLWLPTVVQMSSKDCIGTMEVEGVLNVDLSGKVEGHTYYGQHYGLIHREILTRKAATLLRNE